MEISEEQIDHYFREKWFELTNTEEISQRALGVNRKPIVVQCTSSIFPPMLPLPQPSTPA